MPTALEEIQMLASDSTKSIADMLRRVKIAATKLGLPETVTWVDRELNGYPADDIPDKVPDYRFLAQRLVYRNPFHGWQPVVGDTSQWDFFNDRFPLTQAIKELEELSNEKEAYFYLSVTPDQQRLFFNSGVIAEVRHQFARTVLSSVLDAIRTRVLDWTLELESAGVRGEGVSFTPEEKKIAQAQAPTISIHVTGNATFGGPIGSNTGPISSQTTQYNNTIAADARKLAVSLREAADSADEGAKTDLRAAAGEIEEAVSTDPPDEGLLRKALTTARAVIPRLALWAGRVTAETEISSLMHALTKTVGS
jgi:hypothetical protein